jgi:hypothetical protein
MKLSRSDSPYGRAYVHEGDTIDEAALKALIRTAVPLNGSALAKRRTR